MPQCPTTWEGMAGALKPLGANATLYCQFAVHFSSCLDSPGYLLKLTDKSLQHSAMAVILLQDQKQMNHLIRMFLQIVTVAMAFLTLHI